MAKLPKFLQNHPVRKRHPLRDVPMSGWIALHKWLSDNRESLTSEDIVTLMLIELERQTPRLQIMLRLKGTHDVIRRQEEQNQLLELF